MRLHNMKIALMRLQLLRSHILNSERVVDSVGNYDVAVAVIVGSRQQRVDIRKDGVAEV